MVRLKSLFELIPIQIQPLTKRFVESFLCNFCLPSFYSSIALIYLKPISKFEIRNSKTFEGIPTISFPNLEIPFSLFSKLEIPKQRFFDFRKNSLAN